MHLSRTILVVASVALSVGCADVRTASPPPTRAPVSSSTPVVDSSAGTAPATRPVAPARTIADLIRVAKERHPTAEALRATREAAYAREVTAATWANPDLTVQAGRTRPRQDGFERDVPYGATVTQRLEWVSKREARIRAAQAASLVSDADATVELNALEAEVRLAVITLAVAREEAAQATSDATLAEEVKRAVERGFAAGDRDSATVSRARLEAATAEVRSATATRAADTALGIVRLWCGNEVPVDVPAGDLLPKASPAIDAKRLATLAPRDPKISALAAAVHAAEAQAAAERAARIPDLTVGVFADRENEKDTLGVSFGIEIPLWNRNNGPIAEAEAQQRKAAAGLRRRHLDQQMALVAAVGDYDAARVQADSLSTTVLPLAEETLRLRTAGFANGDLSLTDLLEARRALLATQTALLDARRRTAETLVRLGQVVGRYDLTTPPTSSSVPETTP